MKCWHEPPCKPGLTWVDYAMGALFLAVLTAAAIRVLFGS